MQRVKDEDTKISLSMLKLIKTSVLHCNPSLRSISYCLLVLRPMILICCFNRSLSVFMPQLRYCHPYILKQSALKYKKSSTIRI